MHGDNVHLTFYQVAHVCSGDGLFSLEESVEFVGFGIDDGVGRVDIFADVVFLLKDTSCEGYGFAADGEDGEDDSIAEAVIESSVFALSYYADTDLGIHIIGNELFSGVP